VQVEVEVRSVFEADPKVLAEGEFLKAMLTGIESTEEPSIRTEDP